MRNVYNTTYIYIPKLLHQFAQEFSPKCLFNDPTDSDTAVIISHAEEITRKALECLEKNSRVDHAQYKEVDRELLAICAELHDIGYNRKPRNPKIDHRYLGVMMLDDFFNALPYAPWTCEWQIVRDVIMYHGKTNFYGFAKIESIPYLKLIDEAHDTQCSD